MQKQAQADEGSLAKGIQGKRGYMRHIKSVAPRQARKPSHTLHTSMVSTPGLKRAMLSARPVSATLALAWCSGSQASAGSAARRA
jgi:hypothetical protein